MLAHYRRDDSATGIALTTAAGFAAGLLAGIVAGELLGAVSGPRLRQALRRFKGRPPEVPAVDPAVLTRAVMAALRKSATTRPLGLGARALGMGLVELTGTAPDEVARLAAADAARAVPGVGTVVNRILVAGVDLPTNPKTPRPNPV